MYMHLFKGTATSVAAVWSNSTAMDLALSIDPGKIDMYDTMANPVEQSGYRQLSVPPACQDVFETACAAYLGPCNVCAGQHLHQLRGSPCSDEDVKAYCGEAFAVKIPASRPVFFKVAGVATETLVAALRGATAKATFPGAVAAKSVGSGDVNVTLTGMSATPLDGIVDFGSQRGGDSVHFTGLKRGDHATLTLHSGATTPSTVRVRVGDERIISSSFPISELEKPTGSSTNAL